MYLNVSHLEDLFVRIHHHVIACPDRSFHQSAGYYGTESFYGEDPVNGKPEKHSRGVLEQAVVDGIKDKLLKFLDIKPCKSRHLYFRSTFHEGSLYQFPGIFLDEFYPFLVVGHVPFREYDYAASDIKHLQYAKMLHSLRHHAFIQSYYQKHHIYAADTHEHVLYELLMTRHVYH